MRIGFQKENEAVFVFFAYYFYSYLFILNRYIRDVPITILMNKNKSNNRRENE
jgi:hypothetical protein